MRTVAETNDGGDVARSENSSELTLVEQPPRFRPGIALGICFLLGIFLIVDQLHIVIGHHQHWVNEDHTLLWVAARDLGQFKFFQPNYYGMAYFTVFEAIPAEIFRRLGMELAVAVPLATALLVTSPWFFFCAVSLKARRPLAAVAALAAPLIISTDYLVSAGSPGGRGAGTFIGCLGVTVLLARPSPRAHLLGSSLSCLGLAWDFGLVFLVAPVLIHVGLQHRRQPRRLLPLIAGLVPAATWGLFARAYYLRNPDANLHVGPGFRPTLRLALSSAQNLGQWFTPLSPELAPFWWIPILLGISLITALLIRRKFGPALASIVGVASVVASLSTPKTWNGTASDYLGYTRFVLAVPFLLWFITYLTDDGRFLPSLRKMTAPLLLFTAATLTFALRSATFHDRFTNIDQVAATIYLARVFPLETVQATCDQLNLAVQRTQAQLLVFDEDRTAAYACAATLDTPVLFPRYDRRIWRIRDEMRIPRTSFIIANTSDAFCATAAPVVAECSRLDSDLLSNAFLVRIPAQPVVPLLAQLGLMIRPHQAAVPPISPPHARFGGGRPHLKETHRHRP